MKKINSILGDNLNDSNRWSVNKYPQPRTSEGVVARSCQISSLLSLFFYLEPTFRLASSLRLLPVQSDYHFSLPYWYRLSDFLYSLFISSCLRLHASPSLPAYLHQTTHSLYSFSIHCTFPYWLSLGYCASCTSIRR